MILISSGFLCEDHQILAKAQSDRGKSPLLFLYEETKVEQFESVWMEPSEEEERIQLVITLESRDSVSSGLVSKI